MYRSSPLFEGGLCFRCRSIPFQQLITDTEATIKVHFVPVGTLSDLRNRESCSFCRLVVQGIETTQKRHTDNNPDIEITWERGYGFYCDEFSFPTRISFPNEKEIRILDRSGIDIPRIRQWISVCSEFHSNCSPPEPTPDDEIPNFRAIDVRRKCIAPMPSSAKYVALSYVWGQVDTYKLPKANLGDLMKSEGLTKVWGQIPSTIRDAILLTEAIGEEYLWVDTLCLIQDDANDLIPGIRHMDIIYGRAFCTIIVAGGDDANAGIPGMGSSPRDEQPIGEIHPDINLILRQSMDTRMRQTKYSTRAWTFQEYFLSHRRIIFTNDQAYYLCRTNLWREEESRIMNVGIDDYDNLLSSLQSYWTDNDVFDTYDILTTILFYYSKRHLTHASDVLNAIDGICRTLSIRCKCDFFQGMPVAALDLYLIFHPKSAAERRRGFASYSWSGWHGQVTFEELISSAQDKNDWLSKQTWVIWHKYNPSTGAVSHIWDINQNLDFLEATGDDIGYRDRQPFRPQSAASRLSLLNTTTEPSLQHCVVDRARYSYPLLQFWTVTVYLSVAMSKEQRTSRFDGPVLDVFDRNGDYCGCAHKNTVSTGIKLGESEPIELILLSQCWKPQKKGCRYSLAEIQKYMSRNIATERYSKEYEDDSLFWALWISWDGGVAERVGIAQIFQAAMEESFEPGPVWHEILLG